MEQAKFANWLIVSILFSCVVGCGGNPNTKVAKEKEEPIKAVPSVPTEVKNEQAKALPTNSENVLEAWGEQYASKLGDEEIRGFVDSWKASYGDIDNDGDQDAIGIYYMSEGGNAVFNQVSVFKNTDGVLTYNTTLAMGNTGQWIIDSVLSVSPRKIVSLITVWNPDDAHCCPEGGTQQLVISYSDNELSIPDKMKN